MIVVLTAMICLVLVVCLGDSFVRTVIVMLILRHLLLCVIVMTMNEFKPASCGSFRRSICVDLTVTGWLATDEQHL